MAPRRQWDQTTIPQAIRDWAEQHGRPPRRSDWQTGGPSHPAGNAIYRTYDSWPAALQAAGFDPPQAARARRERGWDCDSVIEAILEWVERFGQPPRLMDWSPSLARRHGYHHIADRFDAERPRYPLASRATRLFGTWNAALTAAGQPTTQSGVRRSTARPRNAPNTSHTAAWTQQDILQAIRAHAQRHARPPTYTEWAASDPDGQRPSAATVFQAFGSWRAAIIAAGHQPRSYTRAAGNRD